MSVTAPEAFNLNGRSLSPQIAATSIAANSITLSTHVTKSRAQNLDSHARRQPSPSNQRISHRTIGKRQRNQTSVSNEWLELGKTSRYPFARPRFFSQSVDTRTWALLSASGAERALGRVPLALNALASCRISLAGLAGALKAEQQLNECFPRYWMMDECLHVCRRL